jgi:molecular chaperone GrpE
MEAEMARLSESVEAADSRALTLEATAATAKDQLLRLNADFENFRRRTVGSMAATAVSYTAQREDGEEDPWRGR